MENAKEFITKNYLTMFLVVFIMVLIFILLMNVKKGTFGATPGVNGVGINCNQEISADNVFTCTVSGSFGDEIGGVSFKYDLDDSLSYVSFTPTYTCSENDTDCLSYNSENGYLYVNDGESLTGDITIGTLRLMATDEIDVGNTYDVVLTEVNLADVDDELIEIDDIELEITISSISEDYYSFDDELTVDANNMIIKNIAADTKYEDIVDYISTNGTIAVKDKDNNTVSPDSSAKTGDRIVITLSDETYTFKVSVLGDVTGDGIIEINDIGKLYRYYMGVQGLAMTEEYIAAGEVTHDGIIEINDVGKLYRYYMGNIGSLE